MIERSIYGLRGITIGFMDIARGLTDLGKKFNRTRDFTISRAAKILISTHLNKSLN